MCLLLGKCFLHAGCADETALRLRNGRWRPTAGGRVGHDAPPDGEPVLVHHWTCTDARRASPDCAAARGECMRAARYHGRGDLRVEDVPEPTPGHGEVLLEVHAAGVCGTDAAEWATGPYQYPIDRRHPLTGHEGPLTPGHEFSGRVISVGSDVVDINVGAVVACGAGFTVGDDVASVSGRPNLSHYYVTVGLHCDGGLAQYVVAPAAICVDVRPFGLSEDAAALAQPMAIAVHALHRARPQDGDDVVVLGAGGIGTFLIYAGAEAGLRVVAADLDPHRLEIAERLGAFAVVNTQEEPDLATALAGRGVVPAIAYEATGSDAGLRMVLASVVKGARVVLVGLHERPREVDLRAVTLHELELIGTNAHVFAVDLPEAVRVLATREQSWSDVAPAAFPLEALVEEAIRPLAEGRSTRVKTLIDPWTDAPRATQMRA